MDNYKQLTKEFDDNLNESNRLQERNLVILYELAKLDEKEGEKIDERIKNG